MKIPSLSFIIQAFIYVSRRFPFSMIAAVVGTVAAIALIEEPTDPDDYLPKLLMTSALGLSLFLSATLLSEKRGLKDWKKWMPVAVAAVALVLYYLSLDFPDGDNLIPTLMRFFALILASHLLVSIVAFTDSSPVEDFWEFNKTLFGNFLLGAFYSLVIYFGLSIAILAVDNLFVLEIDGKIYAQLFVVIAALFNTTFFLRNMPESFSLEVDSRSNYTPAIKTLTKFILIPIVLIYFLILYAYSAKILVSWELPKGWVSSLVLGFSIAGGFTYLLNYLLVKWDDNALVQGFRRWFFFVLSPMVILLFIGIGRRINDYGVTEDRFVVATAGIWLLMLCLYFIFSKKDNIVVVPWSLILFALLTVLGPLNAFRISSNNQAERLSALLEKNGMIKEGIVVASNDSLSVEDAESISSIIHYMREFSHFDKIAHLFPNAFSTSFPDYTQVDSLIGSLNLPTQKAVKGYCNYGFFKPDFIEIEGYSQMFSINLSRRVGTEQNQKDGWQLSEDLTKLIFKVDNEVSESIDLAGYLQRMVNRYKCFSNELPREEGTLDLVGNTMDMRLILEQISFEEADSTIVVNLNAILLARNKQEQ